MAGRLAFDFGTSNTVVGVWDPSRGEGVPLLVPDYGRLCDQGDIQVPVVPSLIHYAPGGERWLGSQVIEKELRHSRRTFWWMKSYIARRSPTRKTIGDRTVSHFEAGKDFLSNVMLFAGEELGLGDEEVALTVPVEAFEDYENWLTEVAEAAGMPRFRLIDEPSASALGYGAKLKPGDVYLVFDFGGGTLDVAVVRAEEPEEAGRGHGCRVLGKAGADLGGSTIDKWLFQEVLRRTGRSDADDDVRSMSNALLVACEQAKERLSASPRARVGVVHPATGAAISAQFAQDEFEALLDEHEAFTQINRTVQRALNNARERGYTEENVREVLMVGGSSQIPSVRRTVQRLFGRDRVRMEHPLDAVARGAAVFVADQADLIAPFIQHDYALRHLDRKSGTYQFEPIVKRGTEYPTAEPVARLRIKGAYDQQRQLGLLIYEVGSHRRTGRPETDLVLDQSGAARLVEITPEEDQNRSHFQIGTATFLKADPPARRGEVRFDVEFGIDGNKRLLVSAYDLKNEAWVYKEYPMVKLT